MTQRLADILRSNVELVRQRDFLNLYMSINNRQDIAECAAMFRGLGENPYPFVKTIRDLIIYKGYIPTEEFFEMTNVFEISSKYSDEVCKYIKESMSNIDYDAISSDPNWWAPSFLFTEEIVDKINATAAAEGYSCRYSFVSPWEVICHFNDSLITTTDFKGVYIDGSLWGVVPFGLSEVKVKYRANI
jgi:hypothetical protein